VLFVQTVGDHVMRKGDESLVTIVANQSAVAIQNARLYEGLQRLNEHLEERVRERTIELESANREIKQAQAQLVQSGKMAALGQLAAGLAHEMNTPLGAINASLDVAERAIGVIRHSAGALDSTSGSAKLRKALQAIQDTNRVSRDACTRVFSIFQTLRSFARLDESALQWTDLHEGLDEAATLLAHRLGAHIEVTRDYGELPTALCYAGELNQVFLILLTNAIEAIEGRGTITLRTRALGERISVDIADSGRGIAPEHLGRVFDPGFTTKGVGVGTGLSLAIAFRIVEKHEGELTLHSAPGAGTTVSVRLPVSATPR
jgi:signal transduction histidine kinase